MKEVAVVSGKGGTGKTTLVASLAALAGEKAVVADCDVDAPDLHLIMQPKVRERQEFFGLAKATIDSSKCTECGSCQENCRFGAIYDLAVDTSACEGCGVCRLVCPADAVSMKPHLSGYAYISETRYGSLVHAELFPGEEASGKLVSMVRDMARNLAASKSLDLILIDGSPGIGCPVIASLTGTSLALVVTEPTISGAHDMERILGLAEHFAVPAMICINKYDLNPNMAKRMEDLCRNYGCKIAARLPFDPAVVEAMVLGRPVVELDRPIAESIKGLWSDLVRQLCL